MLNKGRPVFDKGNYVRKKANPAFKKGNPACKTGNPALKKGSPAFMKVIPAFKKGKSYSRFQDSQIQASRPLCAQGGPSGDLRRNYCFPG